jgi:hypothetical protein
MYYKFYFFSIYLSKLKAFDFSATENNIFYGTKEVPVTLIIISIRYAAPKLTKQECKFTHEYTINVLNKIQFYMYSNLILGLSV